METADLALTAGWGSTQNTGSGSTIVMPGRGLTVERDYTAKERAALEVEGKALGLLASEVFALLGARKLDVHLNADAFWTSVPTKVWDYTLGGYQVIKKWLSYREQSVLGRALKPDEANDPPHRCDSTHGSGARRQLCGGEGECGRVEGKVSR